MSSFYSDFGKLKMTVETSPKWQEKVEAMNTFSKFIKENGKGREAQNEAIVVYANSLSKDFKAANMNILKCCLDCIRCTAEVCGIGPRVAKSIMLSLVPKVSGFRCLQRRSMIASWVAR